MRSQAERLAKSPQASQASSPFDSELMDRGRRVARDARRRHRVVIAGAGVAGLEALVALHGLAGDRVDVTLVSP